MRKTLHSLIAGFALASFSAGALAQQSIMATGDAVTAGENNPSYRMALLDNLATINCAVDMVGDQSQNAFDYLDPQGKPGLHHEGFSPALGYDTDHQAFPGITITGLTEGLVDSAFPIAPISAYVAEEQPDFVLLHLGTRELEEAVAAGFSTGGEIYDWAARTSVDIGLLIDRIVSGHSNPASLKILLANHIPFRSYPDQAQQLAAALASNAMTGELEKLVNAKADPRILSVDVASGFDISTMTDPDGLPNSLGEAHIANAFLETLMDAGLCQQPLQPEVIAQERNLSTTLNASLTPELTSPVPGSQLTGSEATFRWTANGVTPLQWFLRVGLSENSEEFARVRFTDPSTTQYRVTGLPTNGEPLFVQFSYRLPSGWVKTNYQYQAAGEPGPNEPPVAANDSAGPIGTGESITINVLENDTDVNGNIDASSVTVTGQPTLGSANAGPDGRITYTHNSAAGTGTDVITYTVQDSLGATSNPANVTVTINETTPPQQPRMISPAPGTQLDGSSAVFQWESNGVALQQWYLRVGFSPRSGEFANLRFTDPSTTRFRVNGLPTGGERLIVELSYRQAGVWTNLYYEYQAADEPNSPSEPPPLDLSQVNWLYTSVADWAETSVMSSVPVDLSNNQICLNFDKTNEWPAVAFTSATDIRNANAWVFIWNEATQQWDGATWEYLRPGRICKRASSVDGIHIIRAPYTPQSGWRPQSGETVYFMVSGLVRNSIRNVQERTAPVKVIWP